MNGLKELHVKVSCILAFKGKLFQRTEAQYWKLQTVQALQGHYFIVEIISYIYKAVQRMYIHSPSGAQESSQGGTTPLDMKACLLGHRSKTHNFLKSSYAASPNLETVKYKYFPIPHPLGMWFPLNALLLPTTPHFIPGWRGAGLHWLLPKELTRIWLLVLPIIFDNQGIIKMSIKNFKLLIFSSYCVIVWVRV